MKARSPARRLLKIIRVREFILLRTLTAGIAFSFSSALFATDITWTGTVDSYWNNAANWSPQQVPTASDHVVISSGNVNVPADAAFAMMNWTGGRIYGSVTVASNGVLNVSGLGQAQFLAGVLTNFRRVNWLSADWNIANYNRGYDQGGPIYNQPGGLLDIQCDQGLLNQYYNYYWSAYFNGGGFLNNAGTLRKSGSSRTRVFSAKTGTWTCRAGGPKTGMGQTGPWGAESSAAITTRRRAAACCW